MKEIFFNNFIYIIFIDRMCGFWIIGNYNLGCMYKSFIIIYGRYMLYLWDIIGSRVLIFLLKFFNEYFELLFKKL